MVGKRLFLNLLKYDFSRSVNIKMFIAIIISSFIVLLDSWDSIGSVIKNDFIAGSLSSYYFYFNSVIYAGVYASYFLPILSVLPYGTAYCLEKEAGITSFIMARTSKWKYCISKFFIGILSGGIALASGIILLILLLSTRLSLVTQEIIEEAAMFPFQTYLAKGDGIVYFVIAAYRAMLTGMLWASVAIAISAYIPNKYVVIISPFIIKFVLVRFYVISGWPNNMRLDYWLCGRAGLSNDSTTLYAMTINVIVIILACCIIYTNQVTRRVEDNE